MVGTKDGGISGEVVKAVSDDGHNNVQHNERTQEDEGDEIDVGHWRAAPLLRVRHVELSVLGVVPLVSVRVAGSPVHCGHHDVGPSLASCASEEHDLGLENVPEVVVPINLCFRIIGDIAEHLHPNDGIYEEEHHHQHHYIWKSLKSSLDKF